MKILLMFMLMYIGIIQAQNTQQLINYALKKHHSLAKIKYKLSAMDEKIKKTKYWDNPNISLTLNDIQFRKPLSRTEEAMQFNAINVKQKFPWFGKRMALQTVETEKRKVILNSLKEAKVALAYTIRITIYTIKELELRIKILKKYKNLTKENIKLYTQYISTDEMSHTSSIDAELVLNKINIRQERYIAILKAQKEKLNYLVQKKVKKISDKLSIKKPKHLSYYLKRLKNNPSFRRKHSQADVAKAEKDRVDLETYPDPYVQVGYYNRPDYPDYTTISVGVSLPLYETEKLNSQIAKKELLSKQSDALDYKQSLRSDIKISHIKLKEAYRIYQILQHKSMPQIKHLLDLSASAIEEGADLFTYTKVLEEQLTLEEESITILAESMRIHAKLKSLIGRI